MVPLEFPRMVGELEADTEPLMRDQLVRLKETELQI
jgi:hypothetical protein